MKFEENKRIEQYGKILGYLFSYFLFTTILFLILNLLNKIPSSWNYFHIILITLLIVFIGIILKISLK